MENANSDRPLYPFLIYQKKKKNKHKKQQPLFLLETSCRIHISDSSQENMYGGLKHF